MLSKRVLLWKMLWLCRELSFLLKHIPCHQLGLGWRPKILNKKNGSESWGLEFSINIILITYKDNNTIELHHGKWKIQCFSSSLTNRVRIYRPLQFWPLFHPSTTFLDYHFKRNTIYKCSWWTQIVFQTLLSFYYFSCFKKRNAKKPTEITHRNSNVIFGALRTQCPPIIAPKT